MPAKKVYISKAVKSSVLSTKKFTLKSFKFSNKFIYIAAGIVAFVGLVYFTKPLYLSAIVNGKPIFRPTVISSLEKQYGKDVLDSLIEQDLIEQEAKNKNIVITSNDVNTEISNIETQLKSQNMTLDQALTQKGMTKQDLYDQIKVQKTVEKLLGDQITVTDQEIKDYFDQNKNYFATNAKLEDVKSQIQSELVNEKLSSAYTTWIADIKAKAKINYFN